MASVCALCQCDDGEMNVVGEKGLRTLLRACLEKQEHGTHAQLMRLKDTEGTVYVHNNCRRRFVDLRKKALPEAKRLRSSTDVVFCWENCCFLCAKPVDARHKDRGLVHQVHTLPLHSSMVQCANERNDDWGQAVLARLETCIDLVAAEAVYHSSCMADFKLSKVGSTNVRGRPRSSGMTDSFDKICDWLENSEESEVYSIQEVYERMVKDNDGMAYNLKTFREKLKSKYKDHVYFVKSAGCKGELVCFKEMTDYILRQLQEEGSEKKEKVVKAAAKIIKEEIREMNFNKDYYPSVDEITLITEGEKWVPESLRIFMKLLVPTELKQLSLSQCIIQATRPRSVIAPIPFGVGVDIDKTTGCKQLITHLARLGFSITPEEVSRFKQSAIEDMGSSNDYQEEERSSNFKQWVADNVDHNVATMTGKGTFHGMGIVCIDTKPMGSFGKIPRLKERRLATLFTSSRGVEIVPYQQVSRIGIEKFKFDPISRITASLNLTSNLNTYDLLWHSSWFISSLEQPRPNWSGFLQCATSAVPSKGSTSNIKFLPIIDLNPSNESCIYSTLLFVISQAKKLNVQTPCITFDQPLWLKAFDIIHAENLPIVCRLGGFHTLMSFLGSIGTIMKGTGLEDLFSEVYAENSVIHMMSGKAIARAIRAHILAESSLMSLLLEIIKESSTVDFGVLEIIYNKARDCDLNEKSFDELASSAFFMEISNHIDRLKAELREKSRTSELWLLYMNYICIVKAFIFAERTSNWELHLEVLSKMLNLFAATGHINYAKSARLYLQEMRKLPETHPWLYAQFTNDGHHTVQRTRKNWTGIWTDLSIEQTLMRSIKSRGGLTGGRGMTESVRHTWVLSLCHLAMVHDAMMRLTGATSKSSEQHEEIGKSRTKQDYQDCLNFFDWLSSRNPFHIPDENLHSLSSGIVSIKGKDDVNCERAEEIGKMIQTSLDGASYNTSMKRKDQVKTLESLQHNRTVSKAGKAIVDSHSMFIRMITVAMREDNLEEFFDYELTQEPMSLFKNGMLRKADKPSLRKVIMPEKEALTKDDIKECDTYVLDGGALLHRVRWLKGMKFISIAETYVKYIRKNYRSNITVVFDGYQDESTKSHEHLRRNSVPQSCKVKIFADNQVPFTQDRFLSNTENKAGLIEFLSIHLEEAGFCIVNCPGDADSTVVKTSLDIAQKDLVSVTVVADDTDIAVMLVHHWQDNMTEVYFLQERWNKAWSIKEASSRNEVTKEHLLFLHSWSGCDTTSSVFGKGKPKLVENLIKSDTWKQLSEVISNPWSNQFDVGNASVKAFTLLYGGKEGDTLTKLRHNKYIDMACTGIISPEKLPPTERAAFFHGLRSHYQIFLWSLIDDDGFKLEATDWGWKMHDGIVVPIKTDKDIAPESLAKVIRCKCKTTTKNPCGTKTCTCRKYSMPCVSSCGDCRGVECSNCEEVQIENEEENEEESVDDMDDNNIFDVFSNF